MLAKLSSRSAVSRVLPDVFEACPLIRSDVLNVAATTRSSLATSVKLLVLSTIFLRDASMELWSNCDSLIASRSMRYVNGSTGPAGPEVFTVTVY